MTKALFLLHPAAYDQIYGPPEREAIAQLVDVYAPLQTRESIRQNPAILREAEVILSGWGMATLDEAFQAATPNLKAVFYGAGTIKSLVTDSFWKRGIIITSSYAANAVPVIEFTLAQIILSLKRGWHYALSIKREGHYVPRTPVPGAFESTVGIISLGMIGRGVCQRLQALDVKVIAYDPFVSAEEMAELGVEACSLETVFRRADVVSLHTPWLKETEGLITGAHLAAMKPEATFINTARGAIVREAEMIAVLQQRPDLYALLDVTYPEPPAAGSPLYSLPNIVLTPHIAGSLDSECRRMGQLAVDQLRKYLNGEPLEWAITQEQARVMA